MEDQLEQRLDAAGYGPEKREYDRRYIRALHAAAVTMEKRLFAAGQKPHVINGRTVWMHPGGR